MGFIRNYKKNRAIKAYIRELPRLLGRKLGKSKKYPPKLIKSAIESGGLSIVDAHYGIALFVSRKSFEHHFQESSENFDYEDLRREIGDRFFDGKTDYGFADIHRVSSDLGGGADGGGFSDIGDGSSAD